MLRGAYKAQWGVRRMSELTHWLGQWKVVHSDDDIAASWARVVVALERPGRPIGYNDSWIAACCIAADLPLATYNRQHFERVEGLVIL